MIIRGAKRTKGKNKLHKGETKAIWTQSRYMSTDAQA